jgi:hypothetical protein
MLNWIFWLALVTQSTAALAAPGGGAWVLLPFASCGCLCVEGVPRTLCSTIAEAQANPALCPPDQRCPLPEFSADPPQPVEAPVVEAKDCRSVRVWDAAAKDYATVNVCDVVDAAT